MLASDSLIITTDGAEYRSSDGWTHPASDVMGAVMLVDRTAASDVSTDVCLDPGNA